MGEDDSQRNQDLSDALKRSPLPSDADVNRVVARGIAGGRMRMLNRRRATQAKIIAFVVLGLIVLLLLV